MAAILSPPQCVNHLAHIITRLFFNSLDLSRMLHTLQRERDGSALYVSAIAPETKEFLVSSYPETDKVLMGLGKWPDVRLDTNEFQSKENFLNFLNKHRYTLDTDRPDVTEELSFYSKLMSQFMLWFYDAIKEARSGTFWKDLVSLQEIVEAREAFGTERAMGAIFFYTGGFDSMDEYLKFVQSQDVGDVTLTSAREYSPVVEAIHNQTIRRIEEYVGGIVRMRRMIRETVLDRIEPSLANATLWYNNMTLYLDALLSMQVKTLSQKTESRHETNLSSSLMARVAVFMTASATSDDKVGIMANSRLSLFASTYHKLINICWDPFHWHGLTSIPAWISNHIPSKMWDEIRYPFQNFNGCTVEVWKWISNFTPPFIMDVITSIHVGINSLALGDLNKILDR